MRPKWTSQQIEIAVSEYFNIRTKIVIPNVSWGLLKYHEADLLVLYKSNWCSEVEIKVTAQDIKNDLKKSHGHKEKIIKDVWFAVPDTLKDNPDIPGFAGILSVSRQIYRKRMRYVVAVVRLPTKNPKARKFTDEERMKLMRLGCLRIFNLKRKLDENRDKIEELKGLLKPIDNKKKK